MVYSRKQDIVFARVLCLTIAYIYAHNNKLGFVNVVEGLYNENNISPPVNLEKTLRSHLHNRLKDGKHFAIDSIERLQVKCEEDEIIENAINILVRAVCQRSIPAA